MDMWITRKNGTSKQVSYPCPTRIQILTFDWYKTHNKSMSDSKNPKTHLSATKDHLSGTMEPCIDLKTYT